MELSTLQMQFLDSKEFEIVHPITNKKSGSFITIASMNSKLGKKIQLEVFRKTLELKKDNEDIKEEVFKKETSDILSQLILGWRGIKKDGKVYKYSKEKAKDLIKTSDAVYEMVNFNAGFSANFIKE